MYSMIPYSRAIDHYRVAKSRRVGTKIPESIIG